MLPPKFTRAQPLAPGKNATVFRARNDLSGREVFLKVYPMPPADAGSALREPHLLTELEHENLVRIYSADTVEDDKILLEMELITGGSLDQLIDESVANDSWPSTHTCIHLVSDVAAGLSHLATKGFVHRDVKPANLVIRLNGNRRQGVVTDLGLASKLDNAGRAFATRHARIYRPPEVWAGAGYSARSDVYQLGFVLYQLLGGFLDYSLGNLDDVDLAQRAAQGTVLDFSTLGADVDGSLRNVIRKAVAAEARRYESMADFLVALNNAKLQQLDWTYSVTAEGFRLERRQGVNTYRVDVAVEGDKHVATRSQAGSSGRFRKKNPAAQFEHEDIGTCRAFRRFVVW